MHPTIIAYLEAFDVKTGQIIEIPGLVGDPRAFGEVEIVLDGSALMLADFSRFHDTHRALRFLLMGQDVLIRERTKLAPGGGAAVSAVATKKRK